MITGCQRFAHLQHALVLRVRDGLTEHSTGLQTSTTGTGTNAVSSALWRMLYITTTVCGCIGRGVTEQHTSCARRQQHTARAIFSKT